jgi:hypothetical protein
VRALFAEAEQGLVAVADEVVDGESDDPAEGCA